MHDIALDDYEWPTCTTPTCRRDLREAELQRHVCRLCEDRARDHLRALPALFTRLNTATALTRRVRPGGGARGGPYAPVPTNPAVLSLLGPGGIAHRLLAIEDSWRIALGRPIELRTDGWRVFAPWRSYPPLAVPEHVNFLVINLERACERYDSVGQDIDDVRRLHAECEAALEGGHPGRVPTGTCPTLISSPDGPRRCAAELTATTTNHRIRCTACGTRWDGLEAWRALRLAQDEAAQIAAHLAPGTAA
ncbi:hypothetical protein [Streptomyces sp. C10-9-1]|uniref:hypothetical protein n=1 Tax=Streptomyces sp. C10-9-1 TaxID=1859285 RepID=UPI003F4A1AE7